MNHRLPPEVQFSSRILGDSAFLLFNSQKVFWQFFEDKKDGFALDIVNQDQFKCDNIQRISTAGTHKGYLLPPVYRDEIKKRVRVREDGWMMIFGGLVPRNFDKNKIESNHILIQDEYECTYTTNVNVESHGWDLLPMGLYYDTLYRESMADRYRDFEKTMRFTIPFQKNTSVYKTSDIKPLYDSLRLTDFEITAIRIKAFTSVDGSLKRNMELQDERAQSIVAALQSFQPEKIKSEITSAENWVEFLEAIEGTSYAYMAKMDKEEVKAELKKSAVAEQLEPVLAAQRKGIIELELEKRVSYAKATPAELKTFFNKSIAEKNINEALYLQEVIFHKIRRDEIAYDFLKELEIPQAIIYGSLLINNTSFSYDFNNDNLYEALKTFTRLNELLGGNPKVEYNIYALRLKALLKTRLLNVNDDLPKRIQALKTKGIPEILVTRLMINFSLVQCEIDLRGGKFAEREKLLQFIMSTYQKLKTSDADLLSLARFLAHNSRYEWAEKILLPRIRDIAVSEDVLFYYLELTMYEPRYTAASSYRPVMLNAVNIDRTRFCHLFDPIPQNGVSFQLLEDAVLKKTWCENCNLAQQEGVVK